MTRKIWLDGRLVDEADAKISVFDHGLLYGDGVFEGIRSYDGCIFRLREHLERLYLSARFIMLEIPISLEEMEAAVVDTVRANAARDCYVRLIVTRGKGPLGLLPYQCDPPTIIIIADQVALFPKAIYEEGARLMTSATRRLSPDILNPRIKSLNYLNNVLAKMEARQAGHDEALLLDQRGFVTEGAGDNIFIVRGGVVRTPPASGGALKGITRDFILEIAAELGYRTSEEPFTRFEIVEADEAFLTGTGAEIIPVRELDGRTVGSGGLGPVTREFLHHFRARSARDGVMAFEPAAPRRPPAS